MNIVLYVLLTSHITMALVSLYLHRHLTHRHFTLNPVFKHIIRFYLWLTDGVVVKPWVAQHRKHHRYTDVQGDPHSPLIAGKWRVIGTSLVPNYIRLYQYFDTDWALEHYGTGVPDDWMEKNVYAKYPRLGLTIFLLIDICLFGFILGFIAWLVHLFWVPFCTTASITGFAHLVGYKHPDSRDNSRNLFPLGIILCGDELHNNHHQQPNNPNFAHRWFEFDLTYWYARMFEKLGLLKFNRS
jgi:stearoyl-CoA desaturase (delta-9 desaturase)